MSEEIDFYTKALMYGVAFTIDTLQAGLLMLPFIGIVNAILVTPTISIVTLLVFWQWFRSHQINIFSLEYLRTTVASSCIELFFAANWLPGWTGFVYSTLAAAKRNQAGV